MTAGRRCIGLDVHRDFAQVAVWQDGVLAQAGTFATTPEGVREFAAGLGPADEVALQVTGNTWAIAALLAGRAGRVWFPTRRRPGRSPRRRSRLTRAGAAGAAARG